MTQKRRAETEKRILNAAEAIIARGGVPSLSVNGLVAEADISKPLLYRYFGDLDGVLESAWSHARARIEPLPGDYADADEHLKALLRVARTVAADPVLAAFLADGLRPGSQWSETMNCLVTATAEQAVDDERHVDALLVGAAIFLLLRRVVAGDWMACPMNTPKEMAQFEFALAGLVSAHWKNREARKS